MTRTRPAAAFVLLASLLCGCGPSRSNGTSTLGAAAERTLDEKSARVSYETHLGPAHGKLSFVSQEADLSEPGGRTLYTPRDLYQSHPYPDPITGKKWLRLRRTWLGSAPDDRLRALPYLANGATDAGEGTEDEVLGVPTTRYEATVEVEKAVESVPEPTRELTRKSLEQELLGRRAHVTFWLDADGRLRRVGIRIPPGRKYSRTEPNGDSLTLESGPTASTATIDFSDFGVEVGATPPPAGEVGDLMKP